MISIILIVFIILMVMSRGVDIDLDINVTENFDPVEVNEEVVVNEVVEVEVEDEIVDPWIYFKTTKEFNDEVVEEDCSSGHFQIKRLPRKKVERTIDINIVLNPKEIKEETEEEVIIDDCFSDYFQAKRPLSFEELYYKDLKRTSKRGDHGHKGYTRVQTLAYKKARDFKSTHLNEWC